MTAPPIDIDSTLPNVRARTARLLERHRLAVLLHGPGRPGLRARSAPYRNLDGGFGHALEPDIRAPTSEPSGTFHAFAILAEIGALDDPIVRVAADWVASVAEPDGGIPFSLPVSAGYPRAPFLGPPTARRLHSSRWPSRCAAVGMTGRMTSALARAGDQLVVGQPRGSGRSPRLMASSARSTSSTTCR